jgi:hypothetical protein
MAQTDDYDQHEDPGWFRDQLRQRDGLIAELRSERDEQTDLIRRLREHAEDYVTSIESWRETFEMELTDEGWSWQPFWDEHWKLVDRLNALVRDWNRMIPLIDGVRDVGRPLAASEAEAAYVLKLHRQRKSLRAIADETSLSLRTVRTIIGRAHFSDRTSVKRRKIAIDQHERAHWKATRRTGDALPQQVQAVIEIGQALVQEAKGLGRGR